MIESMKKALEYAMNKSEDPTKIKEYVEEYFALAGYDRRFKFKWRAICGNHKYTYSGIFEYYGREYYFSKIGGELELKY
jgi:hypothetical protein